MAALVYTASSNPYLILHLSGIRQEGQSRHASHKLRGDFDLVLVVLKDKVVSQKLDNGLVYWCHQFLAIVSLVTFSSPYLNLSLCDKSRPDPEGDAVVGFKLSDIALDQSAPAFDAVVDLRVKVLIRALVPEMATSYQDFSSGHETLSLLH